MKKLLLLMALLNLTFVSYSQQRYESESPDGTIKVVIDAAEGLSYSLFKNGEALINKSDIALVLSDGKTLSGAGQKPKVKTTSGDDHIVAPLYRVPSFDVEYNELNLKFKEFGVIFRLYDEGVAYRLYTLNKQPIIIEDEIAEFNIQGDRVVYGAYSAGRVEPYASSFQNIYTVDNISKLSGDKPMFLPITVAYDNQTKLTILESDLESYPGMFLVPTSGTLKGDFAGYPSKMTQGDGRAMTKVAARESYIAKIEKGRELPWRVMAITQKDSDMPTNNLVYALASPSRVDDTSWIEGGQSIWEWWNDWGVSEVDFEAGINMRTYRHYIDFASENGIEFVTIDEGWYVPKSGDMFNIANDLDIEEIVDYGKERGVGVVLWCVFNVFDDNLEKICAHYAAMGVKGFKVDFLDRDDQTAQEMIYRVADMAAKYHLVLDYHGVAKPTGLNRTYPNLINIESVFGMEEVKWSSVEKNMPLYDVTFPYIRMMAGSVDFTPGAMRNATKRDFKSIYHNPMSMGTRAHQVATYVVYDSPFTMLADNTTAYNKEPESLQFITSIPACGILDTKVLSGRVGEYIVTARKFDEGWFVGGLTNWDARDVELDFSFLEEGNYTVTLFRDGVNAHKVASDYAIESFEVSKGSKHTVKMASGGGFVMRITK